MSSTALNLANIAGNAYAIAEARRKRERILDLAEPFEAPGSIVSPGYGAQAVVCTYQVPRGYMANLTGILAVFEGSNFVPGSGDLVWSIDVNAPLGFPLPTAYTLQDFARILIPKGSYDHLWPVNRWLEFSSEDILRLKVLTVQNVGVGAPNFVNGILHGSIWPKE
jgi:hypothetical protein